MKIVKEDDEFRVDVGGVFDEPGWSVSASGLCAKVCPHCVPAANPDKHDEHNVWICPRVVVSTNQGGYDCTGVCLDCILEAAALLSDFDFSNNKFRCSG